jgi:hypothetical protein
MELLDTIRGYLISGEILALVALAFLGNLNGPLGALWAATNAALGALCGIGLFTILSFRSGWDQYFAARAQSAGSVDYIGSHQRVASFIRFLGSLDASALGMVFGALSLFFAFVAYRKLRAFSRFPVTSRKV